MANILSLGHKNLHKLGFYTRHATQKLLPAAWARHRGNLLMKYVDVMPEAERDNLEMRVSYYNKLSSSFVLPGSATTSRRFARDKSWAYYLDLSSFLYFFPEEVRFLYRFGDVTDVPELPTFLKSRPVAENNRNSVLLKLNQVRHYYFVRDRLSFDSKLDKLVWRGACHQPHRRRFIKMFHDHPLCDVGDVHRKAEGKPWHRKSMSVAEQLNYKFIFSIEGNDVATNLKWIMASNSLCFMTRPKFETWFMEGMLIPDHHYVLLKDDYSDLDEKLSYYSSHPEEAKRIILNANQHAGQFFDNRKELIINLLVMRKYFDLSGQ